jgi:hypothetical protein
MPESQGQYDSALAPTHRVVVVHRVGAVVVAVAIAAFGVLGFVGGLGFFDTRGAAVVGLSSNGLLSTISVITAVLLVLAAVRGGRFSSTVMIVVGALFIVSAFANLGVMNTPYNFLAFRWPNVIFSIVAGLVLLFLGGYGRLSAGLPADNPYRTEHAPEDADQDDPHAVANQLPFRAATRAERAADAEMAEASRAIAAGSATPQQRRRMDEVDQLRVHEDRRDRWMALARRDEQSAEGAGAA